MPLIQEKLAAPPLPSTLVARPRLNDHFILDERIRLLVVQAPPGYGKSTLLAERLPALEQSAAWLRLDGRDDAPDRFAGYFRAALARLCRELGLEVGLAEGGALIDGVEAWLTALPDSALPGRLVIDEFEHVRHPEILEALGYWLRHQPGWLTLTLVSRTRPALGLPALRLRGELEEVGHDELAFDLEEAQTLCTEQLSFPPTRVSLEQALRRTEGWVMALDWLIQRTTTRAGFDSLLERLGGSHPDFVAWFDDLLETCLDEPDRRLLLQLGVLERFSPTLVARLLEGERVSQRLEALEGAGLFLERCDPHEQWFRFQPLFAGYLRYRRHALSLASQRQLHRCASQAWLALGDPALALAQAIEADDPEGLITLVEAQGPQLLAHGHFALLARALATLGETCLCASPQLTLLHGWVSHAQFQFDRTAQAIGWIEAQLEEPAWQELAAEFATLRAQLAINQGDAERAAPLAEQALTQPARYLAATPVSAGAILCEARFVQGRLEESLARIHEVEREAKRIGDDQLMLWALCHHSETLVAQGRGDQAQCADHIRRIRKILADGDYHIDWRANAHATLLAWWQANDDRDAVARWLQEAPPAEPDTASNHFAQANVRNHARALMLLGRPDEARGLLEALETQAARFGLVTDANRNRLCLALLEWQYGHEPAALDHLAAAMGLASRTALTGSFLRLGRPLSDMLTRLLETREMDELARRRAERLLELAGRQRDFGRAVRLMLDESVIADIVARPDVPELIRTSPLTRREWQILGLIHAGLSNEQIAEQLSVAPTTIKTHIRSLYQKQGIRRREEAIALAGDLLARIQGE
ncbi:LuxR C-terminal-related transcriptional regulator [Halomonas sp. 25-S5]|uniref:LuxR C-terminal-related transcriptional regulator n=1 Tax=Halomonas sp. 25-S5 TaxID=2994065 RepID=UPI002469A57D|nr:LuxR C-terminal-related transcriptional regulator [Halomonas sp. 25-S5]